MHDTLKAYLVNRERMEAIIETLEVLSNPDALQAIEEYKYGKTRLQTLEDFERMRRENPQVMSVLIHLLLSRPLQRQPCYNET